MQMRRVIITQNPGVGGGGRARWRRRGGEEEGEQKRRANGWEENDRSLNIELKCGRKAIGQQVQHSRVLPAR